MILILAMLGCTGEPPAPSAPIAVPAPKPAEPEGPAGQLSMQVGLPFIHKGLYIVSTEGTPPLLVALVQVTEVPSGGYYEEWLLTNKDGGIAGVDFAKAGAPYTAWFGKAKTLYPYPNRLPWTRTRNPDPNPNSVDTSPPLVYSRYETDDLSVGGLKMAACKTGLKDNAAVVHYVTAEVTTQTPPKELKDPPEVVDPGNNLPRHWNEVFESVPASGPRKKVGYMYAEGETTSDAPPNHSTRVWELVNTKSFVATDKDYAPSRVDSGWPGSEQPKSRGAWFDAAVIALGETSKYYTLISGTALGYDALACP